MPSVEEPRNHKMVSAQDPMPAGVDGGARSECRCSVPTGRPCLSDEDVHSATLSSIINVSRQKRGSWCCPHRIAIDGRGRACEGRARRSASLTLLQLPLLLLMSVLAASMAAAATAKKDPPGKFPQEEAALLDFSKGLFSKEGIFDDWDPATNPNYCTWNGVECWDDGHVKSIDINQGYLLGTISASLSRLTALRSIDFHRNFLYGTFPSGLAALPSLTSVRVSINNMSGPIPEAFWRTELKTLTLFNNSFSGSISERIGNASSLRNLRLQGNEFTGSIPSSIGACSRLMILNLAANKFTGEIPSTVVGLQRLWALDVRNNSLTGTLPESLSGLTNIRNLTVGGNSIGGTVPTTIMTLPKLAVLSLGPNQLSGPIPSHLGALTNLSRLELQGNSFNGSLPQELTLLTALQYLNVANNPFVTGPLPNVGLTLGLLSYLNASGCNFTGPLPDSALTLPVLSSFDFSDNAFSGTLPPSAMHASNSSMEPYIGNCFVVSTQPNASANCTLPPANGYCFLPQQKLPAQCLNSIPESDSSVNMGGTIAILVCIGTLLLLIAFYVLFLNSWHRRQHLQEVAARAQVPPKQLRQKSMRHDAMSEPLIQADTELPGMLSDIRRFAMAEVWDATDDFSAYSDPNDLRPVFRGTLDDGEVATFRLMPLPEDDLPRSKLEFVERIVAMHRLRRPSLLCLEGYAYEEGCFVAAFEAGRQSLFDRLHETVSDPPLTWRERMAVLVAVADGLDYLHAHGSGSGSTVSTFVGSPFRSDKGPWMHGDVKSSNIILTPGNKAKLAEYLIPQDPAEDPLRSTTARGSFGYLDPLYADTKRLTPASDVYSFGVLMLEVIWGRRAMLDDSSTLIVLAQDYFILRDDYPKLLDPSLHLKEPAAAAGADGVPRHELTAVVDLLQECTQVDEASRPTMREVKETLMSALRMDLNEAVEGSGVSEEVTSGLAHPAGVVGRSDAEIEIEMMSDGSPMNSS